MQQNNIILSVMVISHNQVYLIGRCLESILRQRIRVPWEIVISDDTSTDGTWEWIQELAKLRNEEIGLRMKEIRGEVLDGEFIPEITCSQINSSDYNPTVTSDRCAANKANVYSLARGKYCVNIDADDYLLGDDIYQYQIDQLEAHPECSVAVQNIWYQNDGEPVENGHPWHCKGVLKENEVITLQDYCQRRMFTSNPAFMMRRDLDLNPMEKYGLLFDDPIISMHHIAQGKIICSTKAQYVYVQYKSSIWNQVGSNCGDLVMRRLVVLLNYLKFFPEYSTEFVLSEVGEWVRALKDYRRMNECVCSPLTIRYVERLDSRFLSSLVHHWEIQTCSSKCVLLMCLFINKYHITNRYVMWLFKTLIQ